MSELEASAAGGSAAAAVRRYALWLVTLWFGGGRVA
jgi:hypothetical protein